MKVCWAGCCLPFRLSAQEAEASKSLGVQGQPGLQSSWPTSCTVRSHLKKTKTDAHRDSEGPRCGGVEQGRHGSQQPPEVWVHRLQWPRRLKSGRPWGAEQESGGLACSRVRARDLRLDPEEGRSGHWVVSLDLPHSCDPRHDVLGVPVRWA